MGELVAWLRGVLDEDEQEIRVSSDQGPWTFMLADIAAKRAVLDRCEQYARWAANDSAASFQALKSAGEVIVRLLATAYADWPGYRQEWRP